MQIKPVKPAAISIAAMVILTACLLAFARLEFLERLEHLSFDSRVRVAQHFPVPAATNFGFVFISDDSITAVNNGSLGYRHGLYWPRHIYGRMLRELTVQGAKAVACDIVLPQLRSDHAPTKIAASQSAGLADFLKATHPENEAIAFTESGIEKLSIESDDFFAWQLRRSGIAILAAEQQVRPHPLFATNALAYADISADADADGVLRRARVFQDYRRWHPVLLQAESEERCDLRAAHIKPGKLIVPRQGDEDLVIPLTNDNKLDLADFGGGQSRFEPAFSTERVWHMGVQLAARELGLDLSRTLVDLPGGKITLVASNGLQRVIPVDADGCMFINWEVGLDHPELMAESIESLLRQDGDRTIGRLESITNRWQGRLAVVGSSAVGNDLTDHGATPLEKNTLLVSKHWNVANSIITGRFIQRSSLPVELLAIITLGVITALMSWRLRGFRATAGVSLLALAYAGASYWLFVSRRYWMSLVLPVGGAMVVQYAMLVTYRVVFEERERRRTRAIFSKLVAPEIVNELLEAKNIQLGGARRTLTVLFADVRGFTELTDKAQERADATVRARNLTGVDAEECHDAMARETLEAVNLYLTTVSGLVKKHRGVLDKYIGDCVMAFWGAPEENPQHATACVRMAIDSQRAIHELNLDREKTNQAIEIENRARTSAGLQLKSPLPLLTLGTGINTGSVTVGLMGSDEHGSNYTVFGREVNLASRLESVSGRGRIVIGENTLQELRRDDPALAASCVELEAVTPKGFQKPVRIFEVPWREKPATPG